MMQSGPDPETFGTVGQQYITSSGYIKKLKLSHYTPRRRLGGYKVQLLLILNFGTRWG
jgi:hypothetical protein